MQYKISQLTMSPENKTNTIGEVFVSQPDAIKENLAGKLFILLEIEAGDAKYLKLINFLVSELNRHYYQSEKMILRERLSTIKIDHIFEAALAKTNKALINFVQGEKILLKPELINSIVGVAYANELHFSILGKARAFMIFQNKKDETDGYKIIEVGRDEEGRQPGSAKLFTNVISGSIPAGGYFLFTNEALPEYLSTPQLKDIITTLPPSGAAEQIKNLLKQINSYIPFFGIIIKNTVGARAEAEVVTRLTGAQGSIYGLKSTEERTEKLLAPSGIIDLRGRLNNLKNKFGLGRRFFKPSFSSDKILLRGALFFGKKPNLKFLKNAAQNVRQVFFIFLQAIVFAAKLPFDREKLKQTLAGIKNKILVYSKMPIEWFRRLNGRQKVLIIIALASILIFLQNSLVLNLKNKSVEEEKNYLELQKTIEQKEDQVEATLIYRNESGAKELLAQIKSLLDQFPQKTTEQKNTFSRLDKKYQENLEKIKHLVKISNLAELTDLSRASQNAAAKNISWTADKIFVADDSGGAVYVFDTASKAISTVNITEAGGGLNFSSTAANGAYYLSGDHLWQIDAKSAKASRLSIDLPGVNLAASAGLAIYNNKLYLLNRGTGQIYRLDRQAAGFTRGGAWLKTPADFKSASGMFIDGDIYVLKSGGEAIKYLKGKAEDLRLDTVEPPIKAASRLMVTQKQKFIYILEPESRRLIIFDKTGKFIIQYEIDSAEAVKDFYLNEKAKKIYLLAGNKIIEMAGQYF